jgi:hypothetical protein
MRVLRSEVPLLAAEHESLVRLTAVHDKWTSGQGLPMAGSLGQQVFNETETLHAGIVRFCLRGVWDAPEAEQALLALLENSTTAHEFKQEDPEDPEDPEDSDDLDDGGAAGNGVDGFEMPAWCCSLAEVAAVEGCKKPKSTVKGARKRHRAEGDDTEDNRGTGPSCLLAGAPFAEAHDEGIAGYMRLWSTALNLTASRGSVEASVTLVHAHPVLLVATLVQRFADMIQYSSHSGGV